MGDEKFVKNKKTNKLIYIEGKTNEFNVIYLITFKKKRIYSNIK